MADRTRMKARREARQHALGIDCVDRLTWKDWAPGGEYTRKILVKNIDRASQTIQLAMPTHKKIFITPFPEPITLSSGVSHEIAISFRPVEVVELHDAITISVEGRGSFQVRLDCLTPYAKLSMPSSYDFDYCAVGDTAHAEVQLRNSGTAPVEFTWETPAPFCILPKHAVLDQGEVMHLTILFSPTDACTMVGQAVCRLTGVDEVIATLRVSGIGKYPFIAFQDADSNHTSSGGTSVVRMEAKMGGPVVSREVRVVNPSAVPATVRLRRCDDGLASIFRVVVDGAVGDASSGADRFVIPRGSVQSLRVSYSPSSPDVLHSAVFAFDCVEGNTLQVELTGTTAGPRVTASAAAVDFGAADLDHTLTAKQRTRHLTLRNTSAVDAPFAWANTVPGAAFAVHPHCGVLPAQSSVQVAVTFHPTHPILYYRRLHLVVEGAADVVCVDVFGGGYTSAARPPTLAPADVEAALLRCERGLGLLTPEELENIAAAAAAEDGAGDVHFAPTTDHHRGQTAAHAPVAPATVEVWRRIEEDARGSGVVMRGARQRRRVPLSSLEVVSGRVAVDSPFGADAQHLYTFPAKSAGMGSGGGSDNRGQSVTIMNTANVPAVASWSLPGGPACPYTVAPAQQTIAPHGSAVFQLQCNGNTGADGGADDNTALCTLECYVNFESMSAFYLAPDGCVVPPRCFTVTCTTPTVTTSAAAALAKQAPTAVASQVRVAQQQQQQVCLPACRLGASSYQIIALHNRGISAARYEVAAVSLKQVSAVVLPPNTALADPSAAAAEADVDSSAFSVVPPVGVVPPQSRQLLVVRFRPSEAARYEAAVTLAWRSGERAPDAAAAPADVTTFSLLGEVCLPQLQWRTAGDAVADDVAFAPTCVTGEAQQQAWVRNPTALPVAFRFDTTAGLAGVVRMEPEFAVVPGGGRLPVTLFFSPQHCRAFAGALQLHLEDGAVDAVVRPLYRQQLPFYGEGVYAEVEVEPRVIDVGEAPDAAEQQATLTLYNSGVCDVQYEVRAMRVAAEQQEQQQLLSASVPAVVVPRLHNHRGVLPARTHTTVLVAAKPTPGLTEFLLYAVVSGLATDLGEVPDAASVREAERHPHCRWSLRAAHPAVQIVNVHFPGVARPLAWQQLNLNAVNTQLAAAGDGGCDTDAFSFEHYVGGLAPITMDLGVAHENGAAAAAAVMVALRNTGDCPAPFSLMLPTQHDANTEHWCLENTELADLQYIVDRGIITVAPSQGVIDVGETVQLCITYTHAEVGVHRLPMLLRVGAGERRAAVVLEGRTLPRDVQVLNFHHDRVFELLPVALGDMEPPLQYVTVSNPSADPVEYSVDVAALQAHADNNYGFPIFQCADPAGVVAPHATASIGFYFRPLEARRYDITVLVQTVRGESYYVDLVGTGYHPRETAKTSVTRWVERAMMHVPVVPPLTSQSSVLRVVDDVCTLSAVPYYTLCRRTCVLQLAADAPGAIRYAWHSEQPHHGDAHLSLSPAEGVLQPGEQQTVQVSFYAGSTSQVLTHLLRCTATPATAGTAPREGRLGLSSSSRHGQRSPAVHHKSDASSVVGGAEWVGLLVQARVMPREDYEVLYGTERLATAYMPAMYHTHVDPAAPLQTVNATKKETRFVGSLVDELLRSVIASPGVQQAFTTLCAPRTASYAKMRAIHMAALSSDKAEAETTASQVKGGGLAAAVVTEGVLEELLRGLIGESVAAA